MEIAANARIYVAGHRGLVGSAIWRELERRGFKNLIGVSHADLELCDQVAVQKFFTREKPEYVFLAAARVGGIYANDSRPAEFLYENLQVQNNVVHESWRTGVKKLLFLGSTCIYPRMAPQPMTEDMLMSGPLEPTNQWYAIAKISGLMLTQAYRRQYGCDYISVMPTNLYGLNDNYDLKFAHVMPAMIHRFHNAKVAGDPTVTCWGSGKPKREFLYVDDLARACVLLMEHYSEEAIINAGYGSDVTIKELAELVKGAVGYPGKIVWDESKPDGTPRKFIDSSRLFALGWKPQVNLETGIKLAYKDFLRKSGQTPNTE